MLVADSRCVVMEPTVADAITCNVSVMPAGWIVAMLGRVIRASRIACPRDDPHRVCGHAVRVRGRRSSLWFRGAARFH